MITFVVADVLHSPAQVLVNPVNTVGSMGRGLPRRFKTLYPDMYQQYRQMCRSGRFDIGSLWLYKTPHKWILNFPIKVHWRDAARLEYIEQGLQAFVNSFGQREMRSVSFPMLSAGLGGLDWESEVRPLLEQYLDPLPFPVYIHLYESRNPYALYWDQEDLKNWLYTIPLWPQVESFIADIHALVNQQSTWNRLDNKAQFEVYASGDNGLLFHSADSTDYRCTAAELIAIWRLIESPAYIGAEDLPSHLSVPPILLFSFLAQLGYLHPALLSRNHTQRQIGLFCVPHHDSGRSQVA